MEIKGQKMLKVCSILMIVFGSLALLVSLLGVLGLSLLGGAVAGAEGAAALGGIALILFIVACAGSILELAAGIVGVKAAKEPSINGIKTSAILGIVILAISVISVIYTFINSTFDLTDLIGLIIPTLYVVGVIQYKNGLLALLSGE